MESTEPPVEFPVEPMETNEPSERMSVKIALRNYPNVIFLYPTWLAAIICGFSSRWSQLSVEEPGSMGFIFTVIFFANLSILVFEYTRIASLLLIVGLSAVGFLAHGHPEVAAFIRELAEQPMYMTPTFYWGWSIAFALILLVAVLRARMAYWSVEDGELLHRKKPFRVVERWPLAGMEVTREVNDVLEYLLFRSGRIILRPSGTDRVIVIENVPGVVEVDRQIREALGLSPDPG